MGKRLWAALVTWDSNDEAVYRSYASLMDNVMAIHGGKVQADGTWLQEQWKMSAPFSLALPRLARERGQAYFVAVDQDTRESWAAFLDNPRVWQKAVDGLLTLIESRFDAPWDGVVFAFEWTTSNRKQQLTDWLTMLSGAVSRAGMLTAVTLPGRTEATDNWYDGVYAYDHKAIGAIVNKIFYGVHGYWLPPPRSLAPYWYLTESLRYVMDNCHIPASKMIGNLGSWSKLMPASEAGSGKTYSYSAALELIGETPIRWIEESVNGTLRHNCAVLEDGSTMWLHDGPWVEARLPLLDRRGIDSICLNHPAMTAPSTWDTIADWKRPAPRPSRRPIKRPKTGNHNCTLMGTGGLFSTPT